MKYIISSLIVIIIFLVAGLSYYIGKSSGSSRESAASATGAPVTSSSSTPTPFATTAPPQGKKVGAGGVLSFPKYELTIPDGWVDSKESQTKDDEKITLTKGAYQISIVQGGFGGAICLFQGDVDVEGPSVRYEAYKEIVTQSGDQLRRAWTGKELESKGFGICQNTQYGWGAPTLYGHIAYIVPVNPELEVLAEMDAILSSIKKI